MLVTPIVVIPKPPQEATIEMGREMDVVHDNITKPLRAVTNGTNTVHTEMDGERATVNAIEKPQQPDITTTNVVTMMDVVAKPMEAYVKRAVSTEVTVITEMGGEKGIANATQELPPQERQSQTTTNVVIVMDVGVKDTILHVKTQDSTKETEPTEMDGEKGTVTVTINLTLPSLDTQQPTTTNVVMMMGAGVKDTTVHVKTVASTEVTVDTGMLGEKVIVAVRDATTSQKLL